MGGGLWYELAAGLEHFCLYERYVSCTAWQQGCWEGQMQPSPSTRYSPQDVTTVTLLLPDSRSLA